MLSLISPFTVYCNRTKISSYSLRRKFEHLINIVLS
nr:MAG TPA: hypothetical protein [Bacteriophage sp.]